MILVWGRKRANAARYSVEDHLIGWWVECRTRFVSGRQTVRRPRERPVQGRPYVRWSEKATLERVLGHGPGGCLRMIPCSVKIFVF